MTFSVFLPGWLLQVFFFVKFLLPGLQDRAEESTTRRLQSKEKSLPVECGGWRRAQIAGDLRAGFDDAFAKGNGKVKQGSMDQGPKIILGKRV